MISWQAADSCLGVLCFSTFALAGEIHKLAFSGNVHAVKALLDARTSVDALDEQGRTALMFAIYAGQDEVVALLLTHGANSLHRVRNGHYVQNLWMIARGLSEKNSSQKSKAHTWFVIGTRYADETHRATLGFEFDPEQNLHRHWYTDNEVNNVLRVAYFLIERFCCPTILAITTGWA